MRTYAQIKSDVNRMSVREYDAWRLNPANRAEVALLDSGGTASNIVDLSTQTSSGERLAVFRQCAACGRDVAVPADFQGAVYCSKACVQALQDEQNRYFAVLQKFADETPSFYRCAHNTQQIVAVFQAHPELKFNRTNLGRVYEQLREQGKLLEKITIQDIQQMSPTEYNERLRLDPDLGGFREQIDRGEILTPENRRKPLETPSAELRPDLAALYQAAERARKLVSAAHANRNRLSAFTNGRPNPDLVKLPEGTQIYRNGRLVS